MDVKQTIFWRAASLLSSYLAQELGPDQQVFMRRARGLPQAVKSCVIVRVPRSSATTGSGVGVPSLWGSHLQVDCLVRATEAVDDVADVLLGRVIEALKPEALRNTAISGLQLAQIEWDDDYDGESSVCISISYQLRHGGPHGGGVRV